MYLIVDIETAPDLALWQPPPEDPQAFAPLHAHRPIVIGYVLLDHEYKLLELDAFAIGRGLRQPDLFATPGERDQDTDEHELLLAFSRRVDQLHRKGRDTARNLTVVGFNSRRFDMPVLVLRALKHAVPLPWMFRDRSFNIRYEERGHLDIADAITNFGASRDHTSLDALARMIGLPGKIGCDGSQVAELYARGELDRLVSYCLGDCAMTALLLLRWHLVQFALTPQGYAAREGDLRSAFANDPRLADMFAAPAVAQASNA